MKAYIAIAAALVVLSAAQSASAEAVPSWIKSNAGLWVDGQIGDDVFIQGIQFLIAEQIIVVSPAQAAGEPHDGIPAWVKSTAGLWATGQIQDGEFLGGLQYLVEIGVIAVPRQGTQSGDPSPGDSELQALQAELDACQLIAKAYKRIDCEKAAEHAITLYQYKKDAQLIRVGPINYYWMGLGSEGNSFEVSESGQALLNIRMLAENTGSERVALNCTSPQICNYDVTDGSADFKYAGMDFTSGQIVLNPGGAREFNMLFGPNIGYGGTQFVYDPAKEYHFRIAESFGGANIPLDIR